MPKTRLPLLPTESDSDETTLPAVQGSSRDPSASRIRLLVSACLLGEKVRYDGQHKYDSFLVEMLGPHVEWMRVCPESDGGLPTPRASMHLVGDPTAPRLVSRTGADLTDTMARFTAAKLDELASVDLCGYVCKKDSPSSGMTRVKVYDDQGRAERVGAGLFTSAFMARFPLVPVEEEGRLHDARLRESFVERVFCRRRWLDLVAGGRSRGRLVDFHTDHKFLLLAHGRTGYTALGRLVAEAKQHRPDALFRLYEERFMAAVAQPSTVKKTTDVLLHMMGFFKKNLGRDEKAELLETIEQYRTGLVPLVVPLTLVKHHVRKYEVAQLARQTFLSPYPPQLMLRNPVLPG